MSWKDRFTVKGSDVLWIAAAVRSRVQRWRQDRRALTKELVSVRKTERYNQRKADLAVRIIVGLLPKEDRRLVEFMSAYAYEYTDSVYLTLTPRAGVNGIRISELAEQLRKRLTRQGCKATFGEREFARYSETVTLPLSIEGLAGIGKVSLQIARVALGPDCTFETREVSEVVPATEEEVVVKQVKVAVCTDPVTQERKEVVLR